MNGKKARQNRRNHTTFHGDGASAEVAAASDRDRAYFAAHPDQDVYVRRRMPGEYGPRDHAPEVQRATHTRVRQVARGIRLRRPTVIMRADDYPTGHIPSEHIEAFVEHYGPVVRSVFVFTGDQLDDGPPPARLPPPPARQKQTPDLQRQHMEQGADLDDTAYFAAYPDASWRVRATVPGEWDPPEWTGEPVAPSTHMVVVYDRLVDVFHGIPLSPLPGQDPYMTAATALVLNPPSCWL